MLAQYYTHSTATPVGTDADGFIQRWTILEPIAIEAPSNRIFNDTYLRNAVYETEFFEYDYNTTDGTLVVIGNTQLEGTWSVNVMSTKLMLSNSSASYVFTKR